MLKRITVQNYQSIEMARLDLGGITLIVGPNGSGKSALLRALKAAAFNKRGDGFIRDDKDETSILIYKGDDQLVWAKERGVSGKYGLTVDGSTDVFVKTGAGVPEPVESFLGIRAVPVDKDFSITPQFRMHHDPTILRESGSRMARILGMLTRLHVVVGAQRAAHKDRDATDRGKERNQILAEQYRRELEKLDWVPLLRGACDHISLALAPIETNAQVLEIAQGLIATYPTVQAQAQRELPTTAQVTHVELLQSHCQIIRELIGNYGQLTIDGLSALEREGEAQREEIEAGGAYHEACHKAGVCDICPWR